jgi:magnesium and cobalt exporter, CNNM family
MSAGLLVVIALVLAGLIVASALFSAMETSLFSLQPFDVRRLKETNPRLGESLEKLMENPRMLLSAILFADAAVNLPLMILCLFSMREILPALLPFWVKALVIFALIVFVCDLVPKLAALGDPLRFAKAGVATLNAIMPLFGPVIRGLQNVSEKIADALTPAKFQARRFLSDEEMETLVELSAEEGTLQVVESEMIHEIMKLGDKTVKDCMTPRIDTFAIPDDLTNDEAIRQLREKRYRRVPVYAETPDNVLGILDVKNFLADPSQPYGEIVDPPSFVPETMKALNLLKSFLTHPQGMAVIVDEFGGTEGIVTLSDIVEEIIGETAPSQDRSLLIENAGDGRWIVNGQMRLDELSEDIGVHLEAEGVDTIGGFIFNRLGSLPKPGASLQIGDVSLTVRRTSRKRVEEVLVEKKPAGEGTGAE